MGEWWLPSETIWAYLIFISSELTSWLHHCFYKVQKNIGDRALSPTVFAETKKPAMKNQSEVPERAGVMASVACWEWLMTDGYGQWHDGFSDWVSDRWCRTARHRPVQTTHKSSLILHFCMETTARFARITRSAWLSERSQCSPCADLVRI